jgi:hypothetical protein
MALMFGVTGYIAVNNAHADQTFQDDAKVLRQNVLYKAVYSNLKKCYSQMQSPIEESAHNTWAAFDSATYFSDIARDSSFLKFPYGVGKQNTSSCPSMITGWETNWFINLFTGTGSYGGLLSINKDASVPEFSWYDANVEKMGKFLVDIGYTLKIEGDSSLANRKCFYLKFKLAKRDDDSWWYPNPINGEYLETQDFCVNIDDNGNLKQDADSIIYLKGRTEYLNGNYDSGHLVDSSNTAIMFFRDVGTAPGFLYSKYFEGTVLQTALDFFSVSYLFYNESWEGNDWFYERMEPQTISSTKNAEDSDYCHGLGYIQCGWQSQGFLDLGRGIYGSIMPFGGNISYGNFKSRLVGLVQKARDYDGVYLFDSVSAVDYNPIKKSYERGNSDSKFINYFLKNVDEFDGGVYTDAERYILYYSYLKDYYNVLQRDDEVDGGIRVHWLNEEDGTFSRVYIYDPDEDLNDKKYVLDSSGKWDGTSMGDWVYIANQLAAIDAEKAFADSSFTILDPDLNTDEEDSNPKTEVGCFTGGGALGWILCPLLTGAGEFLEGVYDRWIEPSLRVDATLVEGNGPVFEAWSIFRNIANIVFIVLLLVVIFSQLTGVGIDNYGIKKILPKVVICAILINLSYIVCQLAVDLSNILGYGLRSFFSGLTSDLTLGASFAGAKVSGGATFLTGLVVALLGALGVVAIITQGLAILIPLLFAFLSGVIAVFFLFLLLGVRQVGVVLLVVISPLAFVCYMLPNTKKLFDRWLKMFQGLLLFFPLCGLIIGASSFASYILLSTNADSFFFALLAMLLNVVPFFFLPMLLKTSFAAMGNIGAKISGMGSRAGSGLNKWVKGTDAYKQQQARSKAGIDRNGNVTGFGRLRANVANKTGVGRNALARNRTEALKNRETNLRARNALDGNYVAGAKFNQDLAAQDDRARVEMLTSSDYQAAAQAKQESARQDEEVKTQEALITQGANVNDVRALGAELQRAISTDVGGSNGARIRALQNVLSSKGDAGRQQVHGAMRAAEGAGPVSAEARTAYANNIMNNWAKDYKDNSRSTYDYAKLNVGATPNGTIASHEAQSVNSLKQEQMVAMDEDELNRYLNALTTGAALTDHTGLSTVDIARNEAAAKTKLQELAYGTVNNEQIRQGLKGSQEQILNDIVSANGGYTPPPAPTPAPTVIDVRNVKHRITNDPEVLQVRNDGSVVDSSGATVDIRNYK